MPPITPSNRKIQTENLAPFKMAFLVHILHPDTTYKVKWVLKCADQLPSFLSFFYTDFQQNIRAEILKLGKRLELSTKLSTNNNLQTTAGFFLACKGFLENVQLFIPCLCFFFFFFLMWRLARTH